MSPGPALFTRVMGCKMAARGGARHRQAQIERRRAPGPRGAQCAGERRASRASKARLGPPRRNAVNSLAEARAGLSGGGWTEPAQDCVARPFLLDFPPRACGQRLLVWGRVERSAGKTRPPAKAERPASISAVARQTRPSDKTEDTGPLGRNLLGLARAVRGGERAGVVHREILPKILRSEGSKHGTSSARDPSGSGSCRLRGCRRRLC